MTARAYAMAWLLLLAAPALAWYLSTVGPLKALAFGLVIPESVYLANLRDPELGCRTLALREPEAVVLGDSHSYAAWDFAALERGLGMRVGVCALGGLYAESVPSLVATAARVAPRIKLIVLGLSPRMFWQSPTKEEQIAHHRATIPVMTPDAGPFLRGVFLRERLPYAHEAGAVQRHAARIEALDESAIAAKLEFSTQKIQTLRDWDERLREVRATPSVDRIASEICAKVQGAGARLWVLHIPESPYLEARYSKPVLEAYRGAVNELAACAEKIVLDRSFEYGLGNRHYVNRQLRDSHEYQEWRSSAGLVDELAFDADHLNPVGARVFSLKALERLGAPIRQGTGR